VLDRKGAESFSIIVISVHTKVKENERGTIVLLGLRFSGYLLTRWRKQTAVSSFNE